MKLATDSQNRKKFKTNRNHHTPSDRPKHAHKVLKAHRKYGKGKLEISDIDNIAGFEIL